MKYRAASVSYAIVCRFSGSGCVKAGTLWFVGFLPNLA
jgi:hypothetical protein